MMGRIYELGYGMHLTRRLELKLLQRWVSFEPGEMVCDIGCGKGILDRIVSRCGVAIYGLDADPSNARKAADINAGSRNRFVAGCSEALPFRDGICHKIICNCSMEHFKDDRKAIAEMRRVLRAGGLLFLSVDSFSYPGISQRFRELHRIREQVVNFYTLEELKARLEEGGFSVTRHRYYMKSGVSSLFIRIGARLGYGPLFLLLFPLAYPLSVLGDRCSREQGGYCLAVLATKLEERAA